MVTDGDRNVITGGNASPRGWLIRKYSPAGTLVWEVAHRGVANEINGLAAAPGGMVFAAGSVQQGGYFGELLCITREGKIAWKARYPEPSVYDCAVALADGGAVAAGFLEKDGHNNWLLCRYDKNGRLMWKDIYKQPTNPMGHSGVDSVAVCADGKIIGVGADHPSKNGTQDGLVRMLSPDGKALWTQEYGSPAEPSDEGASGVAVAPDGDIVLVGSQHRPDLARDRDWMIRKYSPDGRLVWSYVYNSSTNGDDVPYGVDVDASGQILVGGWEGGSYPDSGRQWLVQVYDRDGNLVWGSSRGSGAIAPRHISAVKFDTDGSLLAAGGGVVGRFSPVSQPEGAGEEPLMRKAGAICVAVADLEPRNASSGDAAIVSDWIRGRLTRQAGIILVERGEMRKILAEQSFQQSGCTERDCAVKMGRILNAQVIVVGSFGKFEDQYVINIRAVRVDNGKVMLADELRASGIKELDATVAGLSARLAKAIR